MPLVPAKCPECGGLVEVDSEKRAGLCQHCSQPFVVEDAIQTFNTYYNTTNNYNTTSNVTNNSTHNYADGAVVNVYENKNHDFVIEGGILKEYHGESTDITVPENVTELANDCFFNIPISKLYISKNVTTIYVNALQNARCVKELAVDKENLSFKMVDGYLMCINDNSVVWAPEDIEEAILPKNTQIVFTKAFIARHRLKKVVIPASVTCICDYAFYDCTALEEIVIPESVTEIGEFAFYGCTALENINIPKGIAKIANNTFENCTSLTEIDLPESVETLESAAFKNCVSLKKVKMPGVTDVQEQDRIYTAPNFSFEGCEQIETLEAAGEILDTFTSYNLNTEKQLELKKITMIGSCSHITHYQKCLKEVSLIGIDIIPSDAFIDCHSLEKIVIPKCVKIIDN